MPRWLKITLKIAAALVGLIIILFIALTVYVNNNKQKVLAMITTELNKNLNGTLTIGTIDPTLFKGFPGVSVELKDVVLKDDRWAQHHHTLLTAKDLVVSVNASALLKGEVVINKIDIDNADIDLFTDSTGYSNTSIFKTKPKVEKGPKEKQTSSSTQIKRFSLNKVNFVVDDRHAYKLFKFAVNEIRGRMDYPGKGWNADIDLNTMANSFSFNTRKGSFMKNRLLKGHFDISYDDNSQVINVAPNNLNIGDDAFNVAAKFDLKKPETPFTINLKVNDILWSSAANLLAANITKSLKMFDLQKPIDVTCDLNGSFGGSGDPLIYVTAKVKNNVLKAQGGTIENCSFKGVFSNNYINGKGLNDENSVIKLYHFNGSYKDIPFTIDTAFINDLNTPVATGIFRSRFPVTKLNSVIGDESLRFTKGIADLKLAYKADIVNFKFTKPMITGNVDIKNADVNYIPRGLVFKNNSIALKFTEKDLYINNIRLQNGSSIVNMQGKVSNFLNSYYNDPEKILIVWQITSPEIRLGEFLGFLNSRGGGGESSASTYKNSRAAKARVTSQLNTAFDKGQAELHIRVAKLYYKKFLATDVTADILLADNSMKVRNVNLKSAGGSLKMAGLILQGPTNNFAISTTIDNVNTNTFFASFNNFGLKDFTSDNLRGFLSAKADIKGGINNAGNLVPKSIRGTAIVNLKEGALVNFSPIKSVGKFAFPFRNLDNITFGDLKAQFDINGDQIKIAPMQINSSVLNMDVEGVYSLSRGTNIALDVPLRNPKNDNKIADDGERNKKRMKGIVLHILATDGDDGKIKIKWNKNHKKTKTDDDDQKTDDSQQTPEPKQD
ncbi:AsmA-like C-terminal region-containing protein [Mucilaginibacter angelicae]|uniref:AsmA-like C-terminal region-containing protein n=1 Tax=Mucilaginibacter angelicae TaxID=869718 RepID=A0ABV6L807_9SPHI